MACASPGLLPVPPTTLLLLFLAASHVACSLCFSLRVALLLLNFFPRHFLKLAFSVRRAGFTHTHTRTPAHPSRLSCLFGCLSRYGLVTQWVHSPTRCPAVCGCHIGYDSATLLLLLLLLLSFCRVSLTWLACLSNCLSLCFPHFPFFLSLSLCLCVWKVLPVSVTASLHLSIYVYLRLCLRVCVSWAYVCVCCVCLYVATAHISFIKWQHDICKWNFPSTHLELPLPLPSWRCCLCCFCCCHWLCRSLQLLKLTVRQIDWHLSNTFALNAFRRIIKFCVVSLSLHFFAVFYVLQHFRPLKCVAYFLALQPSGICYLSVWQPKHYLFNSIYWWNSLRKFSN